jgi:hypothetical protein
VYDYSSEAFDHDLATDSGVNKKRKAERPVAEWQLQLSSYLCSGPHVIPSISRDLISSPVAMKFWG